jgi:NADH-quinone oxidoreductase E subunit
MEISFNDTELQEIEAVKARYPEKRSALMPILWKAQKKFGWISPEVKSYISELLSIPLAEVDGVASFYTMYHKKPMGKHHVQVCTNVSCMICGGDELYRHASEKLGLKHNECSADGKFSLEEVECMGACGGAPMVAINEDYYENLDKNSFDKLLDSL